MEIFLIVSGVLIFTFGVLKVSNIVKEDISKDSEVDKRLFSEKTRYFLGRYYSGFQLMIGGFAFIVLGLIMYLGS